jgi:predicted glycogen debranching enzyme
MSEETITPLPDTKQSEWLVTNGLGGYASGTVNGVLTRRYHGLLVASMPSPLGRMMMLNAMAEKLQAPEQTAFFTGNVELTGTSTERTLQPDEFHLETGLPVWQYKIGDYLVEKRVYLPHRLNLVHVCYTLLAGKEPIHVTLWPGINFRPYEAPVNYKVSDEYAITALADGLEIFAQSDLPTLRLRCEGPQAPFTFRPVEIHDILYRTEESRGYERQGSLWSPGFFRAELRERETLTLIASVENWEITKAITPKTALEAEYRRREKLITAAPVELREGPAEELVLAADQFIIVPAGREIDAAKALALGDEPRTVIAGYHWFTDWGRDTMISLEGLTIVTGRQREAGWILRAFSEYISHGLIPNMFPEGRQQGLYNTADATLWYFHAIDRYVQSTGDRKLLAYLLPKLAGIVEDHINGTRFGIGVDPSDYLLRQGEPGYQLTWMDAKVGDWVVTPRRGKAVEINALWYNALMLLAGWLQEAGDSSTADSLFQRADRTREQFNKRFWADDPGYLFDVVDGEHGDDAACRPNQIFAISLPHPVLERSRWAAVIGVVTDKLLTPVGLRTLSRDHPDYKPTYTGDLRSRDAAYHQGTVWPWLLGPYTDAWLKVHADDGAAILLQLEGLVSHLREACVGSISEIFDAEPPYLPRGCISQAWSVAEILRSWQKCRLSNEAAQKKTRPEHQTA